jgi:hypothetical protein
LSPERIAKWKERKEAEEARQKFGTVEERVIYYADFYDIKKILQKQWGAVPEFADALGEWRVIEVWLSELKKLRDPDAHRRELLPHQKHLAAGIAGEIRTRLVRYRSKQEATEDFYPRIEAIKDSFGNVWTFGDPKGYKAPTILHPGDLLEFVVTATDPLG